MGQKCPADAKQARSARATGTPKQAAKAVAAAVGTAGAGGAALGLLFGSFGGFLVILATYFAGQGLAHVVRRAAEGNGAPRFRTIAMVGAGAMVATMWIVGFGILVPRGISALSYAAAVYGAHQRFPG